MIQMKLIRFALLPLLLILNLSAHAQEDKRRWIYVTKSALDENYYYNTNIKRLAKGRIIVWTKILGTDKATMLTLEEFDCYGERERALSIVLYGDKQELIGSTTIAKPKWKFSAPDSVGDKMLRVVCNAATKRKFR